MAITIPDRKQIRLTTDTTVNNGQPIPAVAKVAVVNPGPMVVDTVSPAAAGNANCVPATAATAKSYLGYNIVPNVPAGISLGLFRGVIVEGFAGCTPGSPVFIDATSADASGTASGLTHTLPTIDTSGATATTAGTGRVGVAISTTKIRFD